MIQFAIFQSSNKADPLLNSLLGLWKAPRWEMVPGLELPGESTLIDTMQSRTNGKEQNLLNHKIDLKEQWTEN